MSNDNSDLSPCPLCGGGETQVRTNYMPVKMGQKPEIIGVEINHWCDGLTRGAQRRSVHAHGRDRDDAIAAWNRSSAPFAPLAEVERMRAEKEALYASIVGIERAAAGAIYSQESIHAMALYALKSLEVKP